MTNVAESTTEMRTDSLTLLVCLDKEGKASGLLYEDEGDGFTYRNGDYLVTRFDASLNKKNLTVTLTETEGQRKAPARWLRIACVKDGKVYYSPWQSGNTANMKIRKNKYQT